jgi:hypothetical protein
MRYYHATTATKQKIKIMQPKGFYEDATRGCPEPLFGDLGAGFRASPIAETAFSKSIAGAILGAGRFCEDKCSIDIYVTTEVPDVDLSDCGYDFGILDEVRYRRVVVVKHFLRITMALKLIEQINLCYPEEGAPSYSMLRILKEFVNKQLQSGKTILNGVQDDVLEDCWLKRVGITREQWQAYQINPEDDICGAVCPEHGDKCACCDPPDIGEQPMFKQQTLKEHKRKRIHLCLADPAHPHSWKESRYEENRLIKQPDGRYEFIPTVKCWKEGCNNMGYPNAYLGERSVYACQHHRSKK